MKTFDSEDELCDFIASRLSSSGLDRDLLRNFALQYDGVKKEVVWPTMPADAVGCLFPSLRYAIRDDDLKLLDSLSDGLKAAAAVGFFTVALNGPQLVSAGVGMLVAAVKLARQSRKKGAHLNAFEFRVLWVLKANAPSGLTVEEVLEVLNRSEKVDQASVEAVLRHLSLFPVLDGSAVPFVSHDVAGRWRAAGI